MTLHHPLRIVVTGGGTGGHTLPAIAIVSQLRKTVSQLLPDVDMNLLYIGSATGLEARLAPEERIAFTAIATGKLRRAANPLKMLSLQNLIDAARVPVGFLQALSKVKNFHPDVLFSTGGYVSVPAVFAAWLLRVPIVMHEQTVQIGLANRWSAHVATCIALSFGESESELSIADRKKCFVTGSIVRPLILSGNAARAAERYGFVDGNGQLPVLFITGGAQGSSLINRAVRDVLAELTELCCIIHQCGKQRSGVVQDEDLLRSAADQLSEDRQRRYVVTQYVGDEIGDIYALADLVVGRSGAGTVSEICAVGKAALFVPLVPTGGDEQTRNARRLVEVGAAEIIAQKDLTGEILLEKVRALLNDREKLATMGRAAKMRYRPDAVERLTDIVLELGLGRNYAAESKVGKATGKR